MKWLSFLGGLLLIGCASTPLPEAYRGEAKVVHIPPVGANASAEIGQTMISKANLTTVPAIALAESVSDSANPPGTTTVNAGVLPLFASNAEGRFFYDAKATYTLMGAVVPATQSGIFVPHDKSKPPLVYHFAMVYKLGSRSVSGVSETTLQKAGRDSFKRELVYSGISQNTISVLYREYQDNMARPAFSQELKYDLNQGKEIGYKGARFEVIKATNTEIQYKILKPIE